MEEGSHTNMGVMGKQPDRGDDGNNEDPTKEREHECNSWPGFSSQKLDVQQEEEELLPASTRKVLPGFQMRNSYWTKIAIFIAEKN